MSKINENFTRILWILCSISILCFTSFFFYKTSIPNGILEYLWLGVKSIFVTILSDLILMAIIDLLSVLLERNYYKANITSAKMKSLKLELEGLVKNYNQIKNINEAYNRDNVRNDEIKKFVYKKIEEKEKEIKYITDENISFYLKDKLNSDFFSEEGNKLALIIFGYMVYLGILYFYTPKKLTEIYEFVETKYWLMVIVILIAAFSIFIYKLIRPNNEMKFIPIWIFSIAITAVILYFTRPSYISFSNNDEFLWTIGSLGFISSLSILISKGCE